MSDCDVVVLGAGPAGLGAALALVERGARVLVAEGALQVGGLCVTRHRDGLAYDVGGHIPFVRDEGRRRWLADLLEGALGWVDRPVSCVVDGGIRRGRYLDQRPDQVLAGNGGASAWDLLSGRFGAEFVDRRMRPYLEKVDGMPLERIAAERVRRLMEDQAAPDGFWYPTAGIGALMEAMAERVRRRGGTILLGAPVEALATTGERVVGVRIGGRQIPTEALVVGIPATRAAALVHPPARDPLPTFPVRAACLVYLALARDRLTDEPWIQSDDRRVPFARMFEPANWSAALVPAGRTVLGCEVYCRAARDDPLWSLADAALGEACAAALADPLGLVGDAREARLVEVVRLPAAWPLVDVARLAEARLAPNWLHRFRNVEVAQGGAVIEAIEAGEEAARRLSSAGASSRAPGPG